MSLVILVVTVVVDNLALLQSGDASLDYHGNSYNMHTSIPYSWFCLKYLNSARFVKSKIICENKIAKTENQAFVEFKYFENQLYGNVSCNPHST